MVIEISKPITLYHVMLLQRNDKIKNMQKS